MVTPRCAGQSSWNSFVSQAAGSISSVFLRLFGEGFFKDFKSTKVFGEQYLGEYFFFCVCFFLGVCGPLIWAMHPCMPGAGFFESLESLHELM